MGSPVFYIREPLLFQFVHGEPQAVGCGALLGGIRLRSFEVRFREHAARVHLAEALRFRFGQMRRGICFPEMGPTFIQRHQGSLLLLRRGALFGGDLVFERLNLRPQRAQLRAFFRKLQFLHVGIEFDQYFASLHFAIECQRARHHAATVLRLDRVRCAIHFQIGRLADGINRHPRPEEPRDPQAQHNCRDQQSPCAALKCFRLQETL